MKFGIILSGCGASDGSEIHEATMTMLAIVRRGATYQIYAPDIDFDVVDHRTKQPVGTKRNVLAEAARIARGDIKPLTEFDANDVDALILPGGFGAAKNLSNYATSGADMTVNAQVAEAVKAVHAANKPIGALCIAPVILAKVLQAHVTLGYDEDGAAAVEKMGGTHEASGHGHAVYDSKNRVFTAPCYMIDSTIADIADDAQAVVDAVISAKGV